MNSFFHMTPMTMGVGMIHTRKNESTFHDQSSSSRVARIKANALQSFKLSQPPSGPVKNEKEVNSRNNALTRTRAGGYMVPKKVSFQI